MSKFTLEAAAAELRKAGPYWRALADASEAADSVIAESQALAVRKQQVEKECAEAIASRDSARADEKEAVAGIAKARDEAEAIKAEAKALRREAEEVVAVARSKAGDLVAKAEEDAAAIVSAAQEELASVKASISAERNALAEVRGEAQSAQAERDSFHAEIKALRARLASANV